MAGPLKMSHELDKATFESMTKPLEREREWLRSNDPSKCSTSSKDGKKERTWILDVENRDPQVRSIARASADCISPLKEVGPGTNRAFWGRRLYHYSGANSEGNRYITESQL